MASRGNSSRGGSTTRKSKPRASSDSRPIATYYYPKKSYTDRAKDAVKNGYNRASSAVRDEVSSVRNAVDAYGNIGRSLKSATEKR